MNAPLDKALCDSLMILDYEYTDVIQIQKKIMSILKGN